MSVLHKDILRSFTLQIAMSTVTIVAKPTKSTTRVRNSKPVNPQQTPAGVEYNTQYNATFKATIMSIDSDQQLVMPAFKGHSRRFDFIMMVSETEWLRFESQKALNEFANADYDNVEILLEVPSGTVHRIKPSKITKNDKGVIVGVM
jgi:hypothetical protein